MKYTKNKRNTTKKGETALFDKISYQDINQFPESTFERIFDRFVFLKRGEYWGRVSFP